MRAIHLAALSVWLIASAACDRPQAPVNRHEIPPLDPKLAIKMPTRREREEEIRDKQQGVATLRRELDRILKIGRITDSDLNSVAGDVRLSPGADLPDGGKAAINEYRDFKTRYLMAVTLLDAIRAAHEKENAAEGTK